MKRDPLGIPSGARSAVAQEKSLLGTLKNPLQAPPKEIRRVFIVAGEPSGDAIGGRLMAAFRRANPFIDFSGIGGPLMEAEGLQSLFDYTNLSLMGFMDVIANLPRLIKNLHEAEHAARQFHPDVFIGIDSPGFCFRLEQRLRLGNMPLPIIHYVAPQVWVWKPKRAKKISLFLDGLMTILPFEPDYFQLHGLPTVFVGHPLLEAKKAPPSPQDIRESLQELTLKGYDPESSKLIALLPGSRRSELKYLLKVLLEAAARLRLYDSRLFFLLPTLAHLEEDVRRAAEGFSELKGRVFVCTQKETKRVLLSQSFFALCASGTVSLELAFWGVPHVVVYTFSRLNNILVRFFVRVRYANLLNIMEDRPVVPEFLFERCRPDLIAQAALHFLNDSSLRKTQKETFSAVLEKLQAPGGGAASEEAVGFVQKIFRKYWENPRRRWGSGG